MVNEKIKLLKKQKSQVRDSLTTCAIGLIIGIFLLVLTIVFTFSSFILFIVGIVLVPLSLIMMAIYENKLMTIELKLAESKR